MRTELRNRSSWEFLGGLGFQIAHHATFWHWGGRRHQPVLVAPATCCWDSVWQRGASAVTVSDAFIVEKLLLLLQHTCWDPVRSKIDYYKTVNMMTRNDKVMSLEEQCSWNNLVLVGFFFSDLLTKMITILEIICCCFHVKTKTHVLLHSCWSCVLRGFVNTFEI